MGCLSFGRMTLVPRNAEAIRRWVCASVPLIAIDGKRSNTIHPVAQSAPDHAGQLARLTGALPGDAAL